MRYKPRLVSNSIARAQAFDTDKSVANIDTEKLADAITATPADAVRTTSPRFGNDILRD